MKAVRYATADGEARLGRLDGDDRGRRRRRAARGLRPLRRRLGADRVGRRRGQTPLAGLRLLHPTVPRNLIAIGLNYRDHAEESDLEIPPGPGRLRQVPLGADRPRRRRSSIPREETRPDYEGEVAVVLGRTLYRASADEARAAVGGITCLHDVSGRRAQLETPLRQFTLGKSFDTFSPMGPCVARADGRGSRVDRHPHGRLGRDDAGLEHGQPDLLDRRPGRLLLRRGHPRGGRPSSPPARRAASATRASRRATSARATSSRSPSTASARCGTRSRFER